VALTDNAVVLSLAKYHPVNARERRLIVYLSQFKLHIKFIAGRKNKVADCLSRLPSDLTEAETRSLLPTSQEIADDFVVAVTPMNGEGTERNGERDEEVKWTVYKVVYAWSRAEAPAFTPAAQLPLVAPNSLHAPFVAAVDYARVNTSADGERRSAS